MILYFMFNRLPCRTDNIYDEKVFADRFRYQLTMFEDRELARIYRLLHAHIAYEMAVAKMTAEICRISYCFEWFDAVEFNRLLSPYDKMYDAEVFAGRFRYQMTMFEMLILITLYRLLHGHIAYEIVLQKITTVNSRDVRNDVRCRAVLKR